MSDKPRIGVVGTGRMGANMAKRLKDVGYTIAALYDIHPRRRQADRCGNRRRSDDVARARYRTLRRHHHRRERRRGDVPHLSPSKATRCSNGAKARPSSTARRFTPKVHVDGRNAGRSARRALARSLHGQLHPAGARRQALSHVGGRREVYESVEADARTDEHRRCATSAKPAAPRKSKRWSTW